MSANDSHHAIWLDAPAALAGRGPVVFALGTFDGLHLGHQAVLKETVRLARDLHALPAALFFSPNPKEFFTPHSAPALMDDEEKARLLAERHGMAAVIRMPFNTELAARTPQDFLQTYFFNVQDLATAGFVVGETWHFGRGNSGDASLLTALAQQHGVRVRAVPQRCTDDGLPISSTRIRKALSDGDLAEAVRLLGRPYALCGEVVAGLHVATARLACPTANLEATGMALPPYGVYAARALLEETEKPMEGIVYVGDAPTIRHADKRPIVELHLFDFKGDLYGRRVAVEPVQFLRPSQSFPSSEALRQQILRDIEQARQILARMYS